MKTEPRTTLPSRFLTWLENEPRAHRRLQVWFVELGAFAVILCAVLFGDAEMVEALAWPAFGSMTAAAGIYFLGRNTEPKA